MNVYDLFGEDASGVVANRRQARDPRYSMSLSPDVRPGEITRQLKKYNLVEGEENLARLDAILVDLCAGIIRHQKQDNNRYGLVAAAVVDPDHNVVYGINNLQSTGKRVHAERAALANYKQKHGEIPEGSVIVTTLSPCTEPMQDREGMSCSELIDTTPIRRVYAGYRDPSQDHLTHDDFDVVVTNNSKLEQLCKGFADCFLKDVVTESDSDIDTIAQEFVEFASDRLRFRQLPHIDFVEHVTGTEHPTFGSYDSATDVINIGTSDRHVMDIMRTLAHELVHHKQRETKSELDGGTASRDENQANSVAGTLMREFADQHPEYFGGKPGVAEGKEQFNYELAQKGFHFEQEIGGVTYRVTNKKGGSDNINIEAIDDKGQAIGFARFWMHQYKNGLESLSTQVRDDWQGKGIAANMYAVMRMLGVNIHPASMQSDDGKKMWDKWNKQGDARHIKSMNAKMAENFADGKHPEDKGDSKRYHVPTKASVSTLRKVAKQGGRKGQLAHWMANMKAGRAKARKK